MTGPAQQDDAPRETGRLPLGGRLAILLGGILPGIAAGTISIMLPRIAEAFAGQGSGLLVKMVATSAGLGMMVGAPLGGVLADRFGRRPVLATTTLVFGLAGVSILAATELWQLIFARFIIGLCAGTMSACYIALIGDHFDGAGRGRWLGYNGAIATLGIVVLNPIAGALTDTGWRNGFLIYAMAFPVLLLVLAGVPRSGAAEKPVAGATPPLRGLPWAMVLLAIITGTLATGTSLYWPFRLRELGIVSARELGFYALPNVMAIGLAGFSYGALRQRVSINAVFAVCGLFSAAGLAMMALAQSPGMVLAGLVVEAVAVGLLTPNLSMYAIAVSTAGSRARTVGLMKGVYFGSPFATQFVLEAASARGGPAAALALIGVMAAGLGIVMTARLSRTRTAAAPAG